MIDEDRKTLYRWFDFRIKRLIQIEGTDKNYMLTDGDVSVLIRFVDGGFVTRYPRSTCTAWVDIQDRMRGMFEGYGRIHGRGYIDDQPYTWIATCEERLS